MNDDPVEGRLRATLRARAEQAEVSGDAWSVIMERATRIRHARLAALAGIAAVALVAIALPLALDATSARRPDVQLDVAPPSTAEPTATASPEASPEPAPAPIGTSWSRAELPGPGESAEVTDVAVLDSTLVAVGSVSTPQSPGGLERSAAIWTSQNGVDWSPVPSDEGVFRGTGGDSSTAVAVTATNDGFVAVGATLSDGTWPPRPVAWTASRDGRYWQRVEVPGEGEVHDVTTLAGRVVAVGGTPETAPAVWHTLGGGDWEQVVLDQLVPEMFSTLGHVAVLHQGVVAIERDSLVFHDDGGDGTWLQRPRSATGLAAGEVESVAVLPDAALFAAVRGEDGALSTQYSVAPDAMAWSTPVPFPPAPAGRQRHVTALVALGEDVLAFVHESPEGASFLPDVTAWASSDRGARWTELGGMAEASFAAVEAYGDRLVAVGYDSRSGDGVATAWITSDRR